MAHKFVVQSKEINVPHSLIIALLCMQKENVSWIECIKLARITINNRGILEIINLREVKDLVQFILTEFYLDDRIVKQREHIVGVGYLGEKE